MSEKVPWGGLTKRQRDWGKAYIQPWIEDETVEQLGERMYQAIVARERQGLGFGIPKAEVTIQPLRLPDFRSALASFVPQVELPKPRQVAQSAAFAVATVVLGYFTGNAWVQRFNELPQARETMLKTHDELIRSHQAYLTTSAPQLRSTIMDTVPPLAASFNHARAIDAKWERLDGFLFVSSLLALGAAVGTAISLPIRRLRRV